MTLTTFNETDNFRQSIKTRIKKEWRNDANTIGLKRQKHIKSILIVHPSCFNAFCINVPIYFNAFQYTVAFIEEYYKNKPKHWYEMG